MTESRTNDSDSDANSGYSAPNTDTEQTGDEHYLEEPYPIVPHCPYNHLHGNSGYYTFCAWLHKMSRCHLPDVKNIVKYKKTLWNIGSFFHDSAIQQIIDCPINYLHLK